MDSNSEEEAADLKEKPNYNKEYEDNPWVSIINLPSGYRKYWSKKKVASGNSIQNKTRTHKKEAKTIEENNEVNTEVNENDKELVKKINTSRKCTKENNLLNLISYVSFYFCI